MFNSALIDLIVKKDGVLSEIYEVKTGVGRQMLYTAIGQLVTHASAGHKAVAEILVVPEGENMPEDFEHAIATLGIKVRRFRLTGSARKRAIALE